MKVSSRNEEILSSFGDAPGDAHRLLSLIAQRFHVPSPSFAACRQYYLQHLEEFREPDRLIGRQIVLPCVPDDWVGRIEARARGERLIAILDFDPNMFGDLLVSYGRYEENAGGWGRLGPVLPSALPPALAAAFAALRPGQIGPAPVETEEGVHIVLLDRILPDELVPFPAVAKRIGRMLHDRIRLAAARQHLLRLTRRDAGKRGM